MSINGDSLKDKSGYNLLDTLEISSEADTQLQINFLGILPLKTVDISVKDEKGPEYLYVGGDSMGVTLYTKGALIVGVAEIINENGENISPGKEAGLKAGDVITEVNGTQIENAAHLSEIINEIHDDTVTLTIKREQTEYSVDIHCLLYTSI